MPAVAVAIHMIIYDEISHKPICSSKQILSRIHKATKNYEKWKSSHNPHFKPWIYPEQMTLPRLDMSQIKPLSSGVSSESIDESGIGEEEIDENDINDI